ncbi:MAG: methyl-accepting chemotaxis protein [Clostridiales bacterium]|nr:methyl-accepting chemotaxis protein [Clostridiales bacterium]
MSKKSQSKPNSKRTAGPRIGISAKIFGGFLVPVVFMIIIGVVAYQKAAAGLTQEYEDSALQTVSMTSQYFSVSNSYVKADASQLVYDSDLNKYLIGIYPSGSSEAIEIVNTTKSTLSSLLMTNDCIDNISIIPKSGVNAITTTGASKVDGFLDDYEDEVAQKYGDGSFPTWIDEHDIIDSNLSTHSSNYIMSYQLLSQNGGAAVVVDISSSYVEGFLETLDLGEGSIVGLVTPGGREVICTDSGDVADGETVFYGQSFYTQCMNSDEPSGTAVVSYHGSRYVFLYCTDDEWGAAVCALVPQSEILKQANGIRTLTVIIVLVAVIVVILIGLWLVVGIRKNMLNISGRLEKVADGDLTGTVDVKSRDEFSDLARSATDMISNTRSLVQKVHGAMDQLGQSANAVVEVSDVLSDYSKDITDAIDEINQGMGRESENAEVCVEQTDLLSGEIQEIIHVLDEVEKLVDDAGSMIRQGMTIVSQLGDRTRQTNEITGRVSDSISELGRDVGIIDQFVETITEIAEQTNLLSLNASIEAARAGEAGKGFAVVAEEIRKLSDDSAQAAGEIRANVEQISARTQQSVRNAQEAGEMVALQSTSVDEVTGVFQGISTHMESLTDGLERIAERAKTADGQRGSTMDAAHGISDSIGQNARYAETVSGTAARLIEKVEDLNRTAESLNENMNDLQREVDAFKIEG